MSRLINTALVGFGLSGKVFQAPFLEANPGFNLHTIVTSGDEAAKVYPNSKIVRNFNEVIDNDDIELVVIATPNEFHFAQIKASLEAGKHVIAEKPLTPTSLEARQLFEIAKAHNQYIFPFQNRRWDGDFLSIKKILDERLLGNILDFEIHFDRFSPTIDAASWRYKKNIAGGTLFDLGIHMIDQVQVLFGLPEAVFCQLFFQRENSIVDDSFDLKMIYPHKNVTIKSSVFVKEQGHRITIHGDKGSFIKYGLDPQENELKEGKKPNIPDWGKEEKLQWGLLHTDIDGKVVRELYETIPGNYMEFFDNVYQVIRNNVEQAVKPEEVINNLIIIEKAIESHQKKNLIPF
ncbi:Gfo/Idh/MocA family oxidoreductase [Bacteroidota bacterium]